MTIIQMRWYKVRLPSAYQEVEYIESSWTQYIDTWLYANQNTTIEAKFSINNRQGDYDKYYGSYWTNADGYYSMFLQSNIPYNNKLRAVNHNNTANRMYVDSLADFQFNEIYTTKHSNTEFYVNWVLQGTMNSSTFTTTYTIYIFWMHSYESWGVTQLSAMKLYSFKMYDWQTLTRDLVPCYRIADWVIGLYDLVNNQFYTNSWTWTFTKWWNV